jgi:hypothetical protein
MTSHVESYLAGLTATSEVPGIQYVVVSSAGVLFEHASGFATFAIAFRLMPRPR